MSAITRATGTVRRAAARARSRQRPIRVSGSDRRPESVRMDGWSTAAVQTMYEAIHGQLIQAPPEYADALIVLAMSPSSWAAAPAARGAGGEERTRGRPPRRRHEEAGERSEQ